MKLLIPIFLNCLLVTVIYLADKYSPAKKLSYMKKQVIIGIVFGLSSAFASIYGVDWLGTKANVRDAAPLSAGLIFGAPAGIISGVIGGLFRWFSVIWNPDADYTQLACSLATVLAGLMAAGLRKFMFDNKKPTWGYGVCITAVCEVVHMSLIFLTNMDNSSYAFKFVKGASLIMILGNALSVGLSIIIVTLLSRDKSTKKKGPQIARTFQRWLLACIVVAYLVTSTFTFFLQNGIAQIETQELFTSSINDVKTDVKGKSDNYLLELVKEIADAHLKNPDTPLTELAATYDVIEINIVGKDGFIQNSTDSSLVNNYNMNSTQQSKEFMVLSQGEASFVQEYGPVGSDGKTMRKFAGIALEDGNYIQVGYSAEQFHKMLDEFVIDVTKNRHVGTQGFVAVCDENLNLVTENEYGKKHISSIGLIPNEEMKSGSSASSLYETPITNSTNGYREDYIYVFDFAEGYCIIAAMPKADAMFMRDASLFTSVFMQVLIFATLFVFIYILIKKVIINNLKKINSSLGQITNGNLDVRVDVRSNEEFSSLSDDINSTVSTLKRYIKEASQRIDKELEYAKQIQLSALPANFPESDNYEIFASMVAAKEVGGDFYDFYKLNDTTLAFLVADVSGKGIPAAMFMMSAKTIIKDLAERGLPVNEIFTQANKKLCENNESGMFVTAWMGILDITTGKLQFANAGHNPPIIKTSGKNARYLFTRPGFVLGGMENIRYRPNRMQLNPKDRLFLYTDGVTEATDPENKLYGEDRLLSFINTNSEVSVTELLPKLKKELDSFSSQATQADDITMLVLDFRLNDAQPNKTKKKRFPADVQALSSLLGFMEDTLEDFECPLKTINSLCVAIEEMFVNIASYSYDEKGGDMSLEIGFDKDSRTVTFCMKDKGIPFDPVSYTDPDVSLSAEERQVGGLGIFIMKKTMDTASYTYENGENILTMTKKI